MVEARSLAMTATPQMSDSIGRVISSPGAGRLEHPETAVAHTPGARRGSWTAPAVEHRHITVTDRGIRIDRHVHEQCVALRGYRIDCDVGAHAHFERGIEAQARDGDVDAFAPRATPPGVTPLGSGVETKRVTTSDSWLLSFGTRFVASVLKLT